MSHTVDLNTFNAAASFPQFSAGQLALALGTADEPYTVRVVNKVGTVLATLSDLDPTNPNQAWPGDIIQTLNAPTTFSITFPKHAFSKADVDVLGNTTAAMEIQILLGSEVIAWGPAIAEQGGSNPGSVTLQCVGVDWYFTKRGIDQEPDNLLSYGGFELGDFTGWRTSGSWAGGTIGDPNITPVIETDNVFQGTYATRITAFLPTNGGLALVSDPVTYTAGPLGNKLTLSFSACVEEFASGALFNAGVVLIAGPPGSNGAPQGGINAKSSEVWRLDKSTPTNIERREAIEVDIPPNATWAVQVLVFAPTGIVVYDHFFLTPHRKLDTQSFTGSPTATVDVSRIVRMVLDHTLSDIHGHNKSDLHIALATPDCGVRQARVYEFTDHIRVDQALAEFIDREDCFDYDILYTATTRTFRIHPVNPAFNPDGLAGQGTDYDTDVVLTYPATPPVASYTTSIDGGTVANQVAALGDGNGPAREEAWDTDTSAIGDTTLQDIVTAPSGAPYNSLAPLALGYRSQHDAPAEVLEVTITREAGGYVPDGTVILHDLLRLGDRLTLDVVDGWHTYDGKWRIVRITRHCRARTKTLTLNRVAT